MAVGDWSFSKMRQWAVLYYPTADNIYLPVGLDLLSVETTHALNTIPTCQITLAVGREATTGEVATIHFVADAMRQTLPIQIWMEAEELSSSFGIDVHPWPAGPILLFEGRLDGLGFTRQQSDEDGTVSFTATLRHWLDDMDFSSALSRSSHVDNPSVFYNPAGVLTGAGGAGPAGTVSQALGNTAFSDQVITADLWGGPTLSGREGILGLLMFLTGYDLLQVTDIQVVAAQTGNTEARSALFRFEPLADFNANPLRPVPAQYRYGTPLAMDVDNLPNGSLLMAAIVRDIQTETVISSANQTLWDKVAHAYPAHFVYSVVPMVDRALVVPFVPGLRSYWQTIYPQEYSACSLEVTAVRPIRGVGVLVGAASATGAFAVQGDPGVLPALGGWYGNRQAAHGMMRFMQGPPWLVAAGTSDFNPVAPGNQAAINNGLFAGLNITVPPVPGVQQLAMKGMLNNFARYMYLLTVLTPRNGVLSGRPRLDIAPGSTVRVVVSEEKFVGLELGLAQGVSNMYGSVLSVTNVFSSEPPQAETRLHIGHLRSEAENRDDSYSVDKHPVWKHVWRGAPLVDHPAFIPLAYNPLFGPDVGDVPPVPGA